MKRYFLLWVCLVVFQSTALAQETGAIGNPNAMTGSGTGTGEGQHDWVLRTTRDKSKNLFWATRTIVMEVNYLDEHVPELVDREEYQSAVEKAMSTWNTLDFCATDIEFVAKETVESETNLTLGSLSAQPDRLNRIVFRKDTWPGDRVREEGFSESSEHLTLALTTTRFGANTGQVIDADIDINASTKNWGTGDVEGDPVFDVQGVLTHELGHVLGFDHSRSGTSTMRPTTSEGVIETRNLSDDDMSGVCFWYPRGSITPGTATEVSTSLASDIGCTVNYAQSSSGSWLLALLGLLLLRRRKVVVRTSGI